MSVVTANLDCLPLDRHISDFDLDLDIEALSLMQHGTWVCTVSSCIKVNDLPFIGRSTARSREEIGGSEVGVAENAWRRWWRFHSPVSSSIREPPVCKHAVVLE